ncbi:hypothetical protein [Streptomyces sp. H39-C1]|uniref:hypothetical protein n=1 Tax=Streptomyces sp. H39-C1 TaxID=3004355 RepID=UPI0022AF02E6|nr:hypothetical protein [Streptomyces sp. H39-C1]MCZ4099844.1 hypothetical protein [Streptomyces sp. H39-C1]
MSKMVLLDVRLFAGGADLSGNSAKAEVMAEVEEKDATNYRSAGWKEVLGGLASSTINAEGQWEAGDLSKVDDASWAQLGGVGPWTIGPTDAVVGSLAYLVNAMRASYKLGDKVGEVAPWSGKAAGSWPVARGQIAHPPGTARTTSGTGTSLQLGAVPAGKRLYATVHVLSVAGTATPTITARVESDNATGFPSPVTQLTFTGATVRGGQILRTDGTAIADDWWRIAWTITGTTPSFLFAAALGIQ